MTRARWHNRERSPSTLKIGVPKLVPRLVAYAPCHVLATSCLQGQNYSTEPCIHFA